MNVALYFPSGDMFFRMNEALPLLSVLHSLTSPVWGYDGDVNVFQMFAIFVIQFQGNPLGCILHKVPSSG